MSTTDVVKDIERLSEPAKTACKLFMSESAKRNIPIFITETLRTAERQRMLYNKGASQLDGYNKKGNHQSGMAWDIACKGNELYNHSILDKAGALGRELGITWGGDWKTFIDKPHFEVTKNWKAPKLAPNTVKVKIKLNGVIKTVDAVVGDNQNFIKIRDLSDEKISVTYSNNKIFINGYHFTGETILVDGSNYIKLRDLPTAIDVAYDTDLKMPVIALK